MAEAFGIFAGALTVAEVAVKLGKQISRAKQAWDEAKDVPENARLLMKKLCLSEIFLSELEADLSDNAARAASSQSGNMAAYCRSALDELTAALDDLTAQINNKKKLKRGAAKLKIAFEKDFWARNEMRLAHVVQMLDLAQGSHLR